jgi:hypothetical protein
MNVAAAADSRSVAIPCRRCARETNNRGIPNGVGSWAAWANSEVVGSTFTRPLEVSHSAGAAIAIAVDIRWAITQPTIFSRFDDPKLADIKNR